MNLIHKFVPQQIRNIYHLFIAWVAVFVNGYPSRKLRVIGVTGTDGKTTTTNLIYWILHFSGKKVGMISTISAVVGRREYDTGFHVTNPEPMLLQALLKDMVYEKCEFAVLEVTSHGLDQKRVEGINFEVAALTNITNEHLNYHKSFENYKRVKAELFRKTKCAVINKDDLSYGFISKVVKNKNTCVSYGIDNKADYVANEITQNMNGLKFKIINEDSAYLISTKLIGKYNIYNVLAAVAVVRKLGIEWKDIQKAISTFKLLPGRLEEIKNKKGLKIFVDFAHTPFALENLLILLRTQTRSRIIVVLGCAGLRDWTKRKTMGAIAAKYADVAIFTAEDPRNENLNDILEEMAKGAREERVQEDLGKKYFLRINERGEAIFEAINKIAKRGDLVVICGKGHEKSMAYGNVEYPWSDQEAVKMTLDGKMKVIKR